MPGTLCVNCGPHRRSTHDLRTRTYTLRQGTLADAVKAASTVSRDIRGDNYGKLEGYWQTEIGPLNQVMHLWSYQDLNQRTQLRAELSKNPRWEMHSTVMLPAPLSPLQ
jgi:NIPSNAP